MEYKFVHALYYFKLRYGQETGDADEFAWGGYSTFVLKNIHLNIESQNLLFKDISMSSSEELKAFDDDKYN